MKNIMNFEKFSEKRIDEILDKINRKETLTREEEFILKNPDLKKEDFKKLLIEDIKSKVDEYGGYITMSDMEADYSPVYKNLGHEIHLIERIKSSSVGVVVYGGYKYATELDSYDVDYEELSIDTLEEINDLLDKSIKDGLLTNI